jgi:hypothetical protein
MLSTIFGVFLIVHALAHAGLATAPIPDDPNPTPGAFFTDVKRSWLFLKIRLDYAVVRWIGITLVALSIIGFIIAGLGVLGIPGLYNIWREIAGFSAGISLLLLILFWHPWLVVGVVVNIGLWIMLFLNKVPA